MKRLLMIPALCLAFAAPALAHNMKVFAATSGSAITGKVYFVGGGAAMAVPVSLRSADGKTLATLTTAADGSFSFSPVPASVAAVVAEGGDGHMAEFPLTAAAPVTVAPAAASQDALAQGLRPLEERIDALENTLRLRDVLGGLGYILGLFGLWAWLKARGRAA
ncbi:MAG TPA: hypothetical protein PKE19_04465 [Aestuariivirga sp.]|nr:hypothetical protein [Aestuariivirga sp.]